MEDNSPQITATILKEISFTKFGGKDHGRFKISYERMQQISGLSILTQTFLEDLEYHCSLEMMTIINLGNEFAVLDVRSRPNHTT
ncbi:MAG: hypothetical protein KAG61_11190 [Bacteriovoracaceae bacterium]|nr:hypothetical protein [Bacteriovoracaceae bacterium]